MTDAEIIFRLGDTKALTDALNAMAPDNTPLALSSVSVWKRRGIPHRHRPAIAALAQSKGVLLPGGFLLAPRRQRQAA